MSELAVVMPVYNEEACIQKVVDHWLSKLSETGIDYKMIILNDGSKDGTEEKLLMFKDNERIDIINKPNSGHGPTLQMGYGRAVNLAEWVFQCDSDDEMEAGHFDRLWNERYKYDALFGIRLDRAQNPHRKIVSNIARGITYFLYGRRVVDPNIPYRLIKGALLKKIISKLPSGIIAPNLIISGVISKSDASVYQCPIPHKFRMTGKVSLASFKLWRLSAKSFIQTLLYRPSVKRADFAGIEGQDNSKDEIGVSHEM